MYDGKSTSAKNKDANRANYTELDTGQHQEVVSKMVQVVAIEGGKKGTIMHEKVDVMKSTSEDDAINQHKAVEQDINEETAVAKMLYEETYSNEKVVGKNTTENMMIDTEQYYNEHNMVLYKEVAKMVTFIDLDRTAGLLAT